MDPTSPDNKLQAGHVGHESPHGRRRGHQGRPNNHHGPISWHPPQHHKDRYHAPNQHYQQNYNYQNQTYQIHGHGSNYHTGHPGNQIQQNHSNQLQQHPNHNSQIPQHMEAPSQPPVTPQGWKRWVPETKQYSFLDNNSYQKHVGKVIEDGSSVYIGNMEWSIEPPDVALWLEGAGFVVKGISMPQIKKRVHFCQVEFESHEDANSAVVNLDMQRMRGRHVKMNLNNPDAYVQKKNAPRMAGSTRLWIGGLPNKAGINQLEDYIRELFHGFHIESLSQSYVGARGSDNEGEYFCFVDLPNIIEARTAIRILNNRETSWGTANVRFAPEGPRGALEYRAINDENRALCEE
ncbi:hypothetical protein TWF481_005070 [Arthrobotrys musiformis]|uniref:RRM domain-containing protein n=1 Tax=Arthrobotrys musiformis TaxID=47236 RepID=A0AAV9WCR7_9PEZI